MQTPVPKSLFEANSLPERRHIMGFNEQTGQFLCEHILPLIKVKNLMRRMKIEYTLPHSGLWLRHSKKAISNKIKGIQS